MIPSFVVIDTNVVVAGLITASTDAPTARILDGMLTGAFPFLLSEELLAEYRAVLLRPRISRLHGLTEGEMDDILAMIALNGAVREPKAIADLAPDRGDQCLWTLLATTDGALLVTGDKSLCENPPPFGHVVSPVFFVQSLRSPGRILRSPD